MDLAAHLLALVAPHRPGDELAPRARLVGASTELGPRLLFAVDGRAVHVEVAPADPPLPHAARSARLAFSYLAGGGLRAVDAAAGLALCRAVAAAAARNEAAVPARLAAEAAARPPRDELRVREVRVARLLEPTDGRLLTLSPYVGCLIGCRFCYAQSHVAAARRLAGLPQVAWGSFVDVRVNAAEVLARELDELPSLPLKFCPIVSDPYQPIEERYRLTRACLTVLRDADPARPLLLLTRSRLVLRDLDLLARLPGAYAGMSLPTVDDAVRRHFEPRGAPVAERLAALAALRAAGVRTFAVAQPVLPGPIDALADALAAAVSSVSVDVLRGVEGAAADFAAYPEAADPGWQAARAAALGEALARRGIAVWRGDLPPELAA